MDGAVAGSAGIQVAKKGREPGAPCSKATASAAKSSLSGAGILFRARDLGLRIDSGERGFSDRPGCSYGLERATARSALSPLWASLAFALGAGRLVVERGRFTLAAEPQAFRAAAS
jgi:hypothetical protein